MMEKRGNSSKIIILLFFIPFFIWILLQFLAPISISSNSVKNLSGHTGISDNKNIIEDIPSPWDIIYSSGDILCHQKAERSFFINGNQMPFCSRCTAIWLGLAASLGFMIFFIIKLDEKFVFILFAGIIPLAIDGLGQLIGFWESNNYIRVFTGLLVGLICGIAIAVIIDEIKDIIYSKKNKK